MEGIFLRVLNMSFTGGVVIVAVLILRVLLKRAPKLFSYALWSVVLFRLACPVSFTGVFSLLPTKADPIPADFVYQETPKIDTGIAVMDNAVNSVWPAAIPSASVNPIQIWVFLGTALWLLGILVMVSHSVFSLIRLKKRLAGSVSDSGGDNRYLSPEIDTPFVLGVFRPKIYLPAALSEQEKSYILLHEQKHIRRLDHVVKLVSYFVLCIHWFNPLVWVSFFLSGKDMEMSCDEAVIRKLGSEVKKEYSSLLLALASGRRIVGGTPLAFGEGDTKGRIQNILGYRKPALWLTGVGLAAVAVLCVGFAANPVSAAAVPTGQYRVGKILYDMPVFSFSYTEATAPRYGVASGRLYRKERSDEGWTLLGNLYEFPLSPEELDRYFTAEHEQAQDALGDVSAVYRADANDSNRTFFLLMRQNNGDLLLAHGYDDGQPMVRWLFRLTQPAENSAAARLWQHRTPYIGDNAAVGNMIQLLPFPEGISYVGFQLFTDEPPYALTILCKRDAQAGSGASSASSSLLLERNACILFSLIGNMASVTFDLDDGNPMRYTGDWADNAVGADLWQESESPEQFEDLLIRIDGRFGDALANTVDALPAQKDD